MVLLLIAIELRVPLFSVTYSPWGVTLRCLVGGLNSAFMSLLWVRCMSVLGLLFE